MSLAVVTAALAVLAISCTAAAAAAAGDTVSARQPLRGNETVVSVQGKFELGIFSPGGSGLFYLGIWYKNVPVQTVIWVGNRVSPLSSAASAELRVSPDDGNLQLVGLSQSSASPGVVWSSNLSSPSASASPGSNVAVIRDNGNLVLLDAGNSSNVLWQSFDHPTNTLVPEAWLGENKLTGEYQTLTSWRNAEDPAPGMFTDTVDTNGSSEFFYIWNGSRAYWRSGVWTGRVFANLPEAVRNVLFNQTYVETSAYRRVTSVLYNNATITRMVLDLTGQTKQYIWVPDSQSWQLFWAAPTVQCDVYALCGPFGVCNQRSQPPCQCPPGFAPAAERDWGLSDWSGGCHRSTPLQCMGNGSTDGFLELPDMKLPNDSLAVSTQSKAECELACLKNCSCQAYTFSGGGGCAVWHDGFRNLQQLYADAGDSSSSLYLRLSESELGHVRGANRKNRSLLLVVGIVLACLAALGASAVITWILVRRRKRQTNMANQKGSSLHVYSYGDLRAATKNFSEQLGSGGFGSVYRGVVNGHTELAVKKLEGLRQGDKQFRTEINTLGLIQHVNLVRLVGFCSSGDEKLLVYEYMPNGSLEAYLFRSSSCPSWRDRYGIMLGVARGLAYLHEGCRECIIHCDIKPENILLDKDLCPKIADFGMAKLVGRDFSRALTTMRGTIGYLAPEWISGLPISAKVDVYSFGMVLFELISGRRNSEGYGIGHNGDDAEAEAGQRPLTFFPVWAAGRVAKGGADAVADPRLHGDVSEEELERACRVACWCIQDQEAQRPTMAHVVQALEGVVDVYVPPVPRALQHLASLT
ncbi:G-type lectin S-receptor-like serine/threonine-protein kinase At2g19130 [Phragmites australis]|uniref:G-type lectin S-receptor-like serine/threonine-protein kinase At2g19130 n=1 Tax=Phragmites australis TaxID=29695 RepID=UPI002D77F800|nr:G-type lectin S-receptor-like serine/threonine-protein kinase At2g19130 [Phragmites australis]